ncbi:hypothetical protein B484DRAFT_421292 [Ochromonadaceae sp. CCMP2298]|nr:hypothetical protein B484DRAFT_421292 [Ochromonadaceae sp. CCMP2298]
MCKGNHEDGLRVKDIMEAAKAAVDYDNGVESDDESPPKYNDDVTGVWASRFSLNNKRTFVHYHCALSTKGLGYRKITLDSDARFLCPAHVGGQALPSAADTFEPADLTKGQEMVPVGVVNMEDEAVLPGHGFAYSRANLDSDEVTSNRDAVKGERGRGCCSCIGMCDNSTCECLQDEGQEKDQDQEQGQGQGQGKKRVLNYSYAGQLIAPPQKRIVECSLMCACSMRRCTNRVVERGSLFKLEVFRLPESERRGLEESQRQSQGQGSSSSSKGRGTTSTSTSMSSASMSKVALDSRWGWGLRTLEFIKKDSFVCELTGQLVLGSSAPMHQDSSGAFWGGVQVAELLAGPDPKDAGRHLHNLLPVGAWEMGLSPLRWAADQLVNRGVVEPVYSGGGHSGSEKEAHAETTAKNDTPTAEVPVGMTKLAHNASSLAGLPANTTSTSMTDSMSISPVTASGASASARAQVDLAAVVRHNFEAIDSRCFSSAASFIRRAPSSSGAMLVRRTVYTNKEAPGAGSSVQATAGPKLALFAARDIEANVELLL